MGVSRISLEMKHIGMEDLPNYRLTVAYDGPFLKEGNAIPREQSCISPSIEYVKRFLEEKLEFASCPEHEKGRWRTELCSMVEGSC